MKNIFKLMLILMISLTFVACSSNEEVSEDAKEETQDMKDVAYEVIEQSDGEKMVKVKQLKPLVRFEKDSNMTYTTTGITNVLGEKLMEGLSDSEGYKVAGELINAEMTAAFYMGQLVVNDYGEDFVYHEDDWYGAIMYVYTHGNNEECLHKFTSYKDLVETIYQDQETKDLIQWCFDNYDPSLE